MYEYRRFIRKHIKFKGVRENYNLMKVQFRHFPTQLPVKLKSNKTLSLITEYYYLGLAGGENSSRINNKSVIWFKSCEAVFSCYFTSWLFYKTHLLLSLCRSLHLFRSCYTRSNNDYKYLKNASSSSSVLLDIR